jgi:hypothetical protein
VWGLPRNIHQFEGVSQQKSLQFCSGSNSNKFSGSLNQVVVARRHLRNAVWAECGSLERLLKPLKLKQRAQRNAEVGKGGRRALL